MKLVNIIVLVVRLFAVVISIQLMHSTAYVLVTLFSEEGVVLAEVYTLIYHLLMLIFAVILWFFPISITKKLIGLKYLEQDDNLKLDENQLVDITFIALGLYLLYLFVSDISWWGVYWFSLEKIDSQNLLMDAQNKAGIIATIFEFIFVLILLIGRHGIYRGIKKIKYGALEK